MTRSVNTFQHSPMLHIIESETVDYDSRTMSFTVFGERDPNLVTVKLDGYVRTLSRDAHIEGLTRLLEAIKSCPPPE